MAIARIERAERYQGKTAISTGEGTYTYQDLLHSSARVASFLLNGTTDLQEEPVAFLVPPSFDYVAVQWGTWRAGGIAVPSIDLPSGIRIGLRASGYRSRVRDCASGLRGLCSETSRCEKRGIRLCVEPTRPWDPESARFPMWGPHVGP